MTSTNRVLDRFFLAVVGLVCLAVGGGLVVVGTAGGAGAADLVRTAHEALRGLLDRTPLEAPGAPGGSWLPLALALACLVLLVLAAWAVLARGGGRTDHVVERDEQDGAVVVASDVAEQLVSRSLSGRRDLSSVHVSTWRVRGEPAVRVRVAVTPGAAPAPVVAAVAGAARELDALLGTSVPVHVEVVAGHARRGSSARVV